MLQFVSGHVALVSVVSPCQVVQDCENWAKVFKVVLQPDTLLEIKSSLKKAGINYCTGQAVHILSTEPKKGEKRKRLIDAVTVLESTGSSETDLHELLQENIKKGRQL